VVKFFKERSGDRFGRLLRHDLIIQFQQLDLQFPMQCAAAQVWSGLEFRLQAVCLSQVI
jgi:hypothetical protein